MLLELANGKLSILHGIDHPTTRKRIQQAIERHPDLGNLLSPVIDELAAKDNLVITAKAAISTAKARVKSSE